MNNSRNPTKNNICNLPSVGMESGPNSAARPLGYESKESPPRSRLPGTCSPARVMIFPKNASWAMRPCLTSTYRRRSKRVWPASSSRPKGSKKPRGGCAPSSDSNAFNAVMEEVVLVTGAGANAAAEPMRRAQMTDFMVRNGGRMGKILDFNSRERLRHERETRPLVSRCSALSSIT